MNDDDLDILAEVGMIALLGFGTVALVTVTGPAIVSFLAANPLVPAWAVVAVLKALITGDDPVKAGVEAGATMAAVVAIEALFAGKLPLAALVE